jgi:lactate permease
MPITTRAVTTGLPIDRLSAGVGRICAPVSLIIPAYIIVVMGGWKSLRAVFPAAAVCGIAFAGMQFVISNFVGATLTDILASLTAIVALVILLQVWKPSDEFRFEGEHHTARELVRHSGSAVAQAWLPYGLLVVLILLWGYKPVQAQLNAHTIVFAWPGLHNLVQRMPPVVAQASPYGAMYTFNWLSAAGTACLVAAILGAIVSGLSLKQFGRVFVHTVKQLLLAELTYAAILGLAFLMNYCGATGTLGLAFAATGALFPIFSALLGWIGVFLTGSDTSANALFGTLQVVTAGKLGLSPVLMASANSAGGVMGKMISLASIALAAAASSMKPEDEGRLFRFTLKHSVILVLAIGLVTMFYARVAPQLSP